MSARVFGERVQRLEDPALLRGQGRFVDDINLPEMAHAAFVRSPHAHATINGIDATAALALDGVYAVYTLADLMPHFVTERLVVGLPSPAYRLDVNRPALAGEEVCHVGEAVAIVVAESRYVAEDGVELVMVDYDPLPAISDCRAALKDGAPLVHMDEAHNMVAEFDISYGDADGVIAKAPHVYKETFWLHRGGSHSIECRGAVARHDPVEDQLTLWSSTQAAHTAMRTICGMLGRDENQVRIITPDVGGGFGPKLVFYPEDVVVSLAALLLGRPVKWIEDRREHFTSSTQERDQYWEAEIAVDDEAKILAVRGSMVHDHGAYTARGINLAYNSAVTVPLAYEVPNYAMLVRLAVTNKVPVTPVRGAGHPQGTFVMERLLDRVAQGLGLDPGDVRRRNLVAADRMPCEKPIKTRGDMPVILDTGDYPKCQALALERADYDGFPVRKAAASAAGRYRGIGFANYVKGTGRGPFESVSIRIGPSGRILVASGAAAMGQSTHTMLAQIVAEQLGGDMNNITVVTGDTQPVSMGIGGSASRQAVTAGSSAHVAAIRIREKALTVAAHMLEASEEDLEIEGDEVRIKGVPDMSVKLSQIAHAVAGTPGYALPEGMEPGMEAEENYVIDDMAFANGTQVVELEVDIETGEVHIQNFVVVHDSGTLINPMVVDGQVMGGLAQGIGNALYEWMRFDEGGQPQTTNLAEYLLMTAPEMPPVDIVHMETPTHLNPLGVKGVGECGVVPAAPAIVAAIEDALSQFGVRIAHAPVMPGDIVDLVRGAEGART